MSCCFAVNAIRLLLAFQSSSVFTSVEDASIGGTVVYRGQHDDSDSPRTPKSRLGIQERTSNASVEDSSINLAEVVFCLLPYMLCPIISLSNQSIC